MSIEDNKAVVGRWFAEFWGPDHNPGVIDELAAPEIRFEYSMHAPCRGREEVREFATRFRAAFPDLAFGATAELIAEGDYVVGQWEGGGTQTGDAFDDIPVGSLPASSGKTMRFSWLICPGQAAARSLVGSPPRTTSPRIRGQRVLRPLRAVEVSRRALALVHDEAERRCPSDGSPSCPDDGPVQTTASMLSRT